MPELETAACRARRRGGKSSFESDQELKTFVRKPFSLWSPISEKEAPPKGPRGVRQDRREIPKDKHKKMCSEGQFLSGRAPLKPGL
jgi:hypothetical protein